MRHASPFSKYSTSSRRRRLPWLLAVVPVLILLALNLLRVGPAPTLDIDTDLPGIGPATAVTATGTEPKRGLVSLRLEIVQGDRSTLVGETVHEAVPFWALLGAPVTSGTIEAVVGSQRQPELEAGEATLRLTAERPGTWLRRPEPTVHEITLPVRLTPPSISTTGPPIYLTQGGSSLVVYRTDAEAVEHGVQIGDLFFPGFPVPGTAGAGAERADAGRAGEQFAFFGAPHDLDDPSAVQLVAKDALGNAMSIPFLDHYRRRPPTTDTIRLSDRFMARVVPAILGQTPELEDQGDLLANYLMINRDLRRANTETLFELAAETQPRFLWDRPFRQLPGSQRMASFADQRTYTYEGREVDQQTHLGFDLASYRQAPVAAANDGVVVLARYFGIYGNTVVVDHGYGVMSLYSHLSGLAVAAGDTVERGQSLGKTGVTGLAGGDHLHFSMLVHGQQVNPLEWWDPNWLQNRIATPLGDGFMLDNTQ